jgi:hypothetical protein
MVSVVAAGALAKENTRSKGNKTRLVMSIPHRVFALSCAPKGYLTERGWRWVG